MADGKIVPQSGKVFASATERTQNWNGIQQEITDRVQRKLAYEVTSVVRIFGNNVTSADVRATLWVQTPDLREQYVGIAKLVSFSSLNLHKMIIILLFFYQVESPLHSYSLIIEFGYSKAILHADMVLCFIQFSIFFFNYR